MQDGGENATTTNKDNKDLKKKEGGAKEERGTINTELQDQTKEKNKLKLSLKDLQGKVAVGSNSKTSANYKFTKLENHKEVKQKREEQIQTKLKLLHNQDKDNTKQIEKLNSDLQRNSKTMVELETQIEDLKIKQNMVRSSIKNLKEKKTKPTFSSST